MLKEGVLNRKLILVPAVLTLAVTLLRLLGEIQGWPPPLFNAEAGGGFAIVGIVWLIPIFGIYFACKLAKQEPSLPSPWSTIGWAVLALGVMMGLFAAISSVLGPTSPVGMLLIFFLSLITIPIAARGWGNLVSTLVVYALAARIPVAILMFCAILGNWGTHYDAPPPGMPEVSWFMEWLLTGLLPQLTVWIAFTAAFGSIFGGVALIFLRARAK